MISKSSSRFFKAGVIAATFILISIPSVSFADTLYRELNIGMSGSDVTSLQTFLALDRTIYPQGRVTGYFGSLTKSAVANFQARNDIPSVGRVGPMTLPIINAQMAKGMGYSGNAPIISYIGLNARGTSANVSWNTNEMAKGVVYFSTTSLSVSEVPNSVTISGNAVMTDSSFRTNHSMNITGLQTNTSYYYIIHVIDQDGNVSVTWPSSFKTTN
jgi:peptidoglycan hydrolase-like protein with peptidoglycan-binding domain